jgi:murein DD-endopeptidase MepM/ murein hydrolase activator NlpD
MKLLRPLMSCVSAIPGPRCPGPRRTDRGRAEAAAPRGAALLAAFCAAFLLLGTAAKGSAQLAEGIYVVLDPPIVYPGAVVRFSASAPEGVRTALVRVGQREFGGELEDGVLTIYFAMDVDTVAGPHRLEYEIGDRRGALTVTVRARKFETEYLDGEPDAVSLADDQLDRAEDERARLDRVWTSVTEERLWRGGFVPPVAGTLGAPFGLRRVFDGSRHSPHSGLDIKAPKGTNVVATNYGKVRLAEDQLFSGKTVVLDHGWGLMSVYAHLSEVFVRPGQHVATGDPVGQVGATGFATDPHLHFAVRLMGARVDPITLAGIDFGPIREEIEAREAELHRCDIEGACDEEGNPIDEPGTGDDPLPGARHHVAPGDAAGGVPPGEGPRDSAGGLRAATRLHAYD